jgi:dTDP-4-dehydrorhamnose 3,5-epimerase-like enzyme
MSLETPPTSSAKPRLFEGGLGIDDRGAVAFVNDFSFDRVRRFYVVSNYSAGFVRAWHGHRLETKYVSVVQGSAIVAAVVIDNWEHPSPDAQVHRYVLSAQKPSVLHIPAGCANGFMSLSADAKLVFFSTATLSESSQDDVRFDARYWNPWGVEER